MASATSDTKPAPDIPETAWVSPRVLIWLRLALVLVGVWLRSLQYFERSSLWLDEAALARNVVDGSFATLIGPLAYAQVAPVGFLWIERAAVLTFGANELALRLFPFVCGGGALILFGVAVRRLLLPSGAALAVWLFATAVPMIYFSAEVKPYSVDLLAAITIAFVTWERTARIIDPRSAVTLGALGLFAWFSNA